MTITFQSTKNTLSFSDPLLGISEEEEFNNFVSITPEKELFHLKVFSDSMTEDPNRFFLYEDYFLKDQDYVTPPRMQFSLLKNDTKIGILYFNYYPDTEYKVHHVNVEIDRQSFGKELLFTFHRIKNFEVLS